MKVRAVRWTFQRKDVHALRTLDHGLYHQLENFLGDHFARARLHVPYPRLNALRRKAQNGEHPAEHDRVDVDYDERQEAVRFPEDDLHSPRGSTY